MRNTDVLRHRRGPLRLAVLVVFGLTVAAPSLGQGADSQPKPNPVTPQGCARNVKGQPNLDLVNLLIAYHECSGTVGCYTADLEKVGKEALDYLKQYLQNLRHATSAHPNEKMPAVVIDIDETALSNWDNMKETQFGDYDTQESLCWDSKAIAPAIKPVVNLFGFARKKKVATIFLTGRCESERAVTEKNLRTAGYRDWTKLIMRNKDECSPALSAEEYKSKERQTLEQDGYLIVLNIGDQWSDLMGGYSLKTFKLPNPFYYIP